MNRSMPKEILRGYARPTASGRAHLSVTRTHTPRTLNSEWLRFSTSSAIVRMPNPIIRYVGQWSAILHYL